MSLSTKLLNRVIKEKKKTAQDEMNVPKYDNLNTPNNHVGNKKTSTVSNPAAGLAQKKDKKPTADVGSARRERGRDLEGPKQKPKKMTEQVASNPIIRMLNLRIEGDQLRATSPEGDVGIVVPLNTGLRKNVNAFLTNPDNRANTAAAATKLFRALGNIRGAKAVDPERGPAMKHSAVVSKGVSPEAGSGLSLEPMAAGKGAWMEASHKPAAGEMDKNTYKTQHGDPAKTAKVRSGRQPDEQTNKGDPGTPKKGEKRSGKQGLIDPVSVKVADHKKGENVHKSMKKMHEAKRELENLLGRKLKLEGFNQKPRKIRENAEIAQYVKEMLPQYVETALWSTSDESTPEGGDPLDLNYGPENLTSKTIETMKRDLAQFVQAAGPELIEKAADEQSIGHVAHDFWLTRNGHGAGFWDGDYSDAVGKALTDISKQMGEVDLLLGDDGEIHHYPM